MMSSFCFFVSVCGDLEPTTVKKRTCGNHYPDSFISFFDRVTRLVDWGRLCKQGILILDICQDPPLAQFKSLPFREAPKTSAMGLSSLYLTHQESFSFAVVWSIWPWTGSLMGVQDISLDCVLLEVSAKVLESRQTDRSRSSLGLKSDQCELKYWFCLSPVMCSLRSHLVSLSFSPFICEPEL